MRTQTVINSHESGRLPSSHRTAESRRPTAAPPGAANLSDSGPQDPRLYSEMAARGPNGLTFRLDPKGDCYNRLLRAICEALPESCDADDEVARLKARGRHA